MEEAFKHNQKIDIENLRDDFPILKRKIRENPLIYFDNAATTQKPNSVIEAIKNFYENTNSNIHRGVHTLSYESTILYEEAHKSVAEFIGAESWKNIVFTRNATESINLVAHGWGLQNLKENDEVIISLMEHHSNIVPWQMLRDLKGIKLKFLDVDDEGNLKMDELPKLINERTKLVGITHASNVLGVVNPIREIIDEAKKVGALVLIDAAQSVPHLEVDVKELGCDFLVASGHKMLGPTGIGFLYSSEELLEKMEPFNYGGDMIEKVTVEKSTWNELPWKFEAGTPNIAGGIGLSSAVDYLKNVTMEKVAEHERDITRYALSRFSELPIVDIYGPKEGERIGVITFNLPGVHPHDVAWVLDEEGIAVRSGHHCAQPLMRRLGIENAIRASFYLYNSKSEVDKMIEAIKKAIKIFKI